MTDRIEVRGLRLMATVGVLDHERAATQPIEIDLVMQVDLSGAAESDRLEETVDYGAVSMAVEEVVAKSRDLLLERLAGRIADTVLGWTAVETVEVAVRKLRPPVPLLVHDTGVRLVRSQAGRSASTSAGPHRVLVALGSNLGDRADLPPPRGQPAVAGPAVVGVGDRASRRPVRSGPVPEHGHRRRDGRRPVRVHASLPTRRDHGRTCPQDPPRARTLDVDVLFYDDVRIESPELVVPHPRIDGPRVRARAAGRDRPDRGCRPVGTTIRR